MAKKLLSDAFPNLYWRKLFHSFNQHCQYCDHVQEMDAIMHFETLVPDLEFVAKLLNVSVSNQSQ